MSNTDRIAELQAEIDRLKEQEPKKETAREKRLRLAPKGKATRALTDEQYKEIITLMRQGFTGARPNDRIATALALEATTGLRISDILGLRMIDIIPDGNRERWNIVEQKTGRERRFTVSNKLYQYIDYYRIRNNIGEKELLFDVKPRMVQKHLKKVCDWLGYEHISTHSFRKYFATKAYQGNNYDIVLVQTLLQHASPTTTQKYIGIQPKQVEDAISKIEEDTLA